ncbi:unnamed protein product [Dibothriocephalus latus]|uniref:Uncharacterized protein n=1 Tax=Dibothriocephalus latus TaxID=60516 RepID=A0A3P7P9E4_DIBLA|nr:unnamed protein product [Dibothriocephalus latus]
MENVFPKFATSLYKELRAILDDEIDGVSLELNEQDLTDLKVPCAYYNKVTLTNLGVRIPNPESALNEEAGRLLLEDYDEYTRQARIFTSVHALAPAATQKLPPGSCPQESTILRDSNGPPEKSTSLKKKKALSVTKKTMKRL